jgi:N-acetylmuramoyl-L-alanine amidase
LVVGGVTPEDVRREIAAELSSVSGAPPDQGASPVATLPPDKRILTISANQLRTYKVKRVVIDPGHGGRDGGAVGYSGNFVEKKATLDIALRVAELLKDQPDLEVLLTREKDKYITLQYRTEFANRQQADLFVSIHCNANRKKSAKGSEVYVYSSRATGSAADAAARENQGGDFIDFVFDDLNHWSYSKRSFFLANRIDERIQERLGQKILRTEQAPFYVLARVKMPSVLVETAFITHKDEEKKLKDPEWRQKIAQAIADGILAYRDGVEDSLERH